MSPNLISTPLEKYPPHQSGAAEKQRCRSRRTTLCAVGSQLVVARIACPKNSDSTIEWQENFHQRGKMVSPLYHTQHPSRTAVSSVTLH